MLCAWLGFISGCKNKISDSRDQFVGTWKEAVTLSIPELSINEIVSKTETVTKTERRSNKITLADLSNPADVKHAVVNGHSIVFDELKRKKAKDGRIIVLRFNGKGKLKGASLTVIGTVRASSEGKVAHGTWTMTGFKQ